MAKIAYKPKRFQAEKAAMIVQVNAICEEYVALGFTLTSRQVYYQFVARDLFPATRRWRWNGSRWVRDLAGTPNAEPNYTWLKDLISDARMAGLIDWDHIVDRTRSVHTQDTWDDPSDIIRASAEQFLLDKWKEQPTRIEVWIEKDALVGVIEGVCNANQVSFFSCRGYTSQSAMWGAGQRLGRYLRAGQDVVILHLGDHDPSGVDMSRDIQDRLDLFTQKDSVMAGYMEHRKWLAEAIVRTGTASIEEMRESDPETYQEFFDRVGVTLASYGVLRVERIALTMDQVETYDPPPNPAKLTDSRAADYIALYGDESWELDALRPDVMADLIQTGIDGIKDSARWAVDQAFEDEHKGHLEHVSESWTEVVEQFGSAS